MIKPIIIAVFISTPNSLAAKISSKGPKSITAPKVKAANFFLVNATPPHLPHTKLLHAQSLKPPRVVSVSSVCEVVPHC